MLATSGNAIARGNPFRGSLFGLAVIAMLAGPTTRAAADEVKPLRLCADPTNLPFSSDDASKPGFYLEIGQALGQALGRPVAYDWYKSYFGKRTVRVTLLGKQCDAMIGLPLTDDFMGPAVIFSKRIATPAYALVTAKDLQVGQIDDLKGKRVAVQYQTTPQNLLALRDDIDKVTVLSPEEGLAALEQGKADVAFVWGPVAGWLNKTQYNGRYRVQPTDGSGLSWDTAIGFAKASKDLRDQVDAILPSLERAIAALGEKYGQPSERPIQFGIAEPPTQTAARPVRPVVLAQSAVAGPTVSDAPAPVMVAAASPEAISAGKELFNGTCAHCHGPDAVQSERKIDLRLLRKRYADDMRAKYWTTVHEGRPAKGMPAWKDVYSDEQLDSVYAYLLTVQSGE